MKKILFNLFCFSSALLFAILGYWQVDRMHWKEGLINQVEKFKNATEENFNFEKYDSKQDLFKKVFVKGKFLNQYEFLLSAKYFSEERDKNSLGYHLITPFLTKDNIIIFVNRGWIPEKLKNQEDRKNYIIDGEVTLSGILRENQGQAPWYMPTNVPAKDLWFWIDLPKMQERLKEKSNFNNIKPVLLQETNISKLGLEKPKFPINISANLEFYNQHLSYVITWFSLSFIVLLMWGIHSKRK
jgi:surfeit locus 1 family protein